MQAIIDAQEDRYLPDGTKIDPRNFLFPQRSQNMEDLSLWNDPRWGRVKQDLSKEQIEQYKTIGEQMNGSINFTNGKSNEIPIPEPAKDSIAYILVGLRSGLAIDDLDEEEIKAMDTFVGGDWRERWENGSLFAEKENTDKSSDKKDSTGDK